jgi:uncharacterized protein involved in exopolysaccharide biosynthesis
LARGSLIPGTKGDRVALDFKGMRDLMRGPEVQAELEERMARVQAALPGSEMRVSSGKVRARAVVARGSDFEEANTGELSKALDLAGGQRGVRVKTNKPRARSN